MDYWILFLTAFVVGTVALSKTKHERYLKIIFLLRTKRFINAIDYIAGLAPRFWLFLVDAALPIFFGGLGFSYLSKHRESHGNLNILFTLTGLLAVLFISPDLITLAVLLLLLILALYSLRNRNTVADFLTGTVFMTIILLKFVDLVMIFFLPGSSPTWFMYTLVLIEGAFGVVPLMFIAFIFQAYDIVFQGSQQPGVSPAVPDVKEGEVGLSFPGTNIFIPIVYALIAIITVLFSHEFAHGIISRVHELELKSTGLLTLGILPIGAFVEPDEEKLKKRPSLQKMQIFIAGSFANLLVSVIVGVILLLSYTNIIPLYSILPSEGMKVVDYRANSTVEGVIERGEILYEINHQSVRSVVLFKEAASQLKPGMNASIVTNRDTYNLRLGEDPENKSQGYIGVLVTQYNASVDFILLALFWVWFFNINICVVNLLPIVPFDGWRILEELVKTFNVEQRSAMNIVKGVVAFGLILLLLNALPLLSNAINLTIELLTSF